MDCGGLGVIQLLVKQLELAETIDQRVKVLERHLPYRESDHVLNLIYNVMTGGSCLQDVEARRRDPVYLDALGARKVPAPSTEGDFLRRFDRNSIWDLMEAVNEGATESVVEPRQGVSPSRPRLMWTGRSPRRMDSVRAESE